MKEKKEIEVTETQEIKEKEAEVGHLIGDAVHQIKEIISDLLDQRVKEMRIRYELSGFNKVVSCSV